MVTYRCVFGRAVSTADYEGQSDVAGAREAWVNCRLSRILLPRRLRRGPIDTVKTFWGYFPPVPQNVLRAGRTFFKGFP
ncbi:hypothetical protein GCM10010495_64460 [Kitasatospora herbaricolor]|nr:hypothetical protein GCM10010495_64460 [Kitasatospora herbaricolor]